MTAPVPPPLPPVAAFDVDGTLSRRDTLLPFLQRLCGAQRLGRALAAKGMALSRMAMGRADRDAVKDALLVRLLAGRDAEEVAAAGQAYADFLVDRGRLRHDTRHRLDEHRTAGHRVVLVSASPDVYLGPLGRRLGVDAVLASGLEVGADGRLTGRLAGRNCRGPEKVTRLDAWLGTASADGAYLYAYGDSDGDRELLARADVGVLVRPRHPLPLLSLPGGEG
ncbi:MAG: HAD-IB family hydrolase [Actinobacteria bacterium]|nr:HAD-IB family hydrolase [Actinomycetota bacterium]